MSKGGEGMKEGWKMVKLGEVCEKTKNIKWQDVATEEIYRYIDLTSVDRETSSILETQSVSSNNAPSRAKQIVSKGDILFATTRPTLKRVCIIPDRFEGDICSTGFCVLRPKNAVLSNWIYYALKDDSFMTYITPLQKGASYPAVTDNDVKNYVVPLPPFEEQHRIVGILDAAFAKIDALKKNAEENLKNAKALFQQVLAQELQPKEGWVEKKIGEVCEVINGRAYKQNELLNKGKYKVLRVGNFFTNNSWYYSDLELEENKYCDKGDLLYAWSASFGPKIWDGERVIYHYHIWKMICNDCIDKFYMHYYLQSSLFIHKALKDLHGTTMAHITKGIMESTSISFPSIEEQHRIVSTLDTLSEKCRRLEQVAQQTIRECDALKQSILRQAFSGEL